MSKTSQLPIVLLLVFLVPLTALSDKRLCADPKCSKTISTGLGKVNYRMSGEGMVSFKINSKINIMSKSAGSDPSYWGITVSGRQGYAPKHLIQETKILISQKELTHEVPVILPGSPAVDSTPVLKTSERNEGTPSAFSDAATAPLNVPFTSGDDQPHVISKNILENSTGTETPVATQVQPPIQVIDGTALPLLDEQPKTATGAVLQDIATAPKTTTSELEQASATTLSTKRDDDKRKNDDNDNKEEAPIPVKSADNQDTPSRKDEIVKTHADDDDVNNADDGDNRPGADARNTIDTQSTAPRTAPVEHVEHPLMKATTKPSSFEQSLKAANDNNPDMKIEKASDGMKTEVNAAETETVEPLANTSSTDGDTNLTNHEAKPAAGSENHVLPTPFNAGINAPDTDRLSVKDTGSLKAELPIVDNGIELNEKNIQINNIPNEQTVNNNEAKSDDEKPKTSGLDSYVQNGSAPTQAHPQTKETAPHSQEPDSESSTPALLNIPEAAKNASDSFNSDHTDEIIALAADGDSVRHIVTPASGMQQMPMLHPPQEEKEAMANAGAVKPNVTPDHEAILEPKMETPKQDSAALSEEQTTTASPAYTYHQPTWSSHMETDGRQVYAHDQHYSRVPPTHTYNPNPTQETSTAPHYAAAGDTTTARDGYSTNTNINDAEHDDSKPTQHAYSSSLKTATATAPVYAHHPADGWDSASADSNAKAAEQQHSVVTESALTGTASPPAPAVHDRYLAESNTAEQQHTVTESASTGTAMPSAPADYGHYPSAGNGAEQQHSVTESAPTATATAPVYAHHPADGWDSASVDSNAKAAKQQHSVVTESALTGTLSPPAPAVHDRYLAESNTAEQQHTVTESASTGTAMPSAPADYGHYPSAGNGAEQQHSVTESAPTATATAPVYAHHPADGWDSASADSNAKAAEQQHSVVTESALTDTASPPAPADHGRYLAEGNAAGQQHSVTESAPTATATPLAPVDYAHYPSSGNADKQQYSVTESAPTSPASAPYGDSTAANINIKSGDHYPTVATHESSKTNSIARAPLQTDEPKERGLFATILGTVDTFWSNVKREVRDVAEKEHLALLENVEPGANIWHRATDEGVAPVRGDSVGSQAAFCYAASDGQAIGGACDNYGNGNSDQAAKPRLTLNEVLNVLTAKMLEMSELLSCLGIAAVSSLLFVFGYYCFCNSNNEGALLSKLNHMERTLISAQKENLILRDETQQIGSQLTTILGDNWATKVMGSESAVSVDNFELEGLLHENEQLRANIRVLEKELEEATESGLELNKMLAEMLSTQGSTTVGAALENQVSELEGLLETQRSEAHHEYNARLADKDREIGELQLIQAEQSARMRSEILSLQRDNDELETEKSNLEARLLEARHEIESSIAKHSEAHGAEVAVLHKEIRDLKQQWESEHAKLQTSLAKVEALEECLKYIKRDPSVNINEVINTANILAEINDLKKKRGTLTSKLDNETHARRLAEDQLQVVMDEVEQLKQHFHSAEKDKLEAQTRLEVLSNYFREKETQLQKELSLKEAMWLKKQGETTSTVDRLTTMQDEIQSLKSQNDELRAEIEAQLAAHKAQTGTLERRSHENWLEARHSERRYNEARAEAATLRQKLTALAGSNDLSRNFETAPSPIQMESPGSPMLGALPPPFLPPPPFMGGMPPPYMNMPPFVPPMPRSMSGGYDYYDDFEEDDDDEDEDEYDSPPHRRRRHDSWNRRDSYSRSRHRDRERYRSPPPPTAGPTNSHASGSSVA